jgi:glycosyltransferase involved in cell wall biosynthesis
LSNHVKFIDAALTLKDEYSGRVEFLLCGGLDTNPTAIGEAYLQQVCDGEYLKWLGYRTDVVDLLRSCHIMVFPSYREGLPKSLIEACAVGRPIVTTDSAGCRDCVADGYNGYLVPVKDARALADKMEILINDEDMRLRMGKNSRQFAEENFDIKDVVQKHLEIYEEITSFS